MTPLYSIIICTLQHIYYESFGNAASSRKEHELVTLIALNLKMSQESIFFSILALLRLIMSLNHLINFDYKYFPFLMDIEIVQYKNFLLDRAVRF